MDQTLGRHLRRLEAFGMYNSKVPSMLILQRRSAVGIQHVSFIQNRVDDLVDDVQFHRTFASNAGSIACKSASSNVVMPRFTLYVYSRSKASRCRQSHVVFG